MRTLQVVDVVIAVLALLMLLSALWLELTPRYDDHPADLPSPGQWCLMDGSQFYKAGPDGKC